MCSASQGWSRKSLAFYLMSGTEPGSLWVYTFAVKASRSRGARCWSVVECVRTHRVLSSLASSKPGRFCRCLKVSLNSAPFPEASCQSMGVVGCAATRGSLVLTFTSPMTLTLDPWTSTTALSVVHLVTATRPSQPCRDHTLQEVLLFLCFHQLAYFQALAQDGFCDLQLLLCCCGWSLF